MKSKFDEVIKLNKCKNVYIFGAGDVAREVHFCLSSAIYNVTINAFLVSQIDTNTPKDIEGVPVVLFENSLVDKSGTVIVAVLEKYRDEICETLDSVGMNNRILLTFESDLWSEVRRKLFQEHCIEKQYRYEFDINDIKEKKNNYECLVYVTRSGKDKPLKTPFAVRSWEREIFAGAALDNIDNKLIKDDVGDNISEKNRQYCELTAMYWMWKNVKSDYIGLSHYRRRFDFTEEELAKVIANDFDVVVTTPVINVPLVRFMYDKNHISEDWDAMLRVVDANCPEYISALKVVGESNYYIPYNMFIMKWDTFDEYSKWLFPILNDCELIIGKKEDPYQNRYIGFLAERLMTAYIYYKRDELKVLFCDKIFLE